MTSIYHRAALHVRNSKGSPLAIAGRLFLASIFVISPLVNLIPNFTAVSVTLGETGVPFPAVALAGAIAFLLAGGLCLAAGYRARTGACLLVVFLIPATILFHAPWNAANAAQAGEQAIHFLKNAGLMGALLLIMVTGPGPGSFDGRRT